jgi:hypothetical protein
MMRKLIISSTPFGLPECGVVHLILFIWLWAPVSAGAIFCLPGETGKPGHLEEGGVTPTEGKTIRLARASLANGGV